jgi:chaperonin GroEL
LPREREHAVIDTNHRAADPDSSDMLGSPILYGAAARAALLRGVEQMAGLISPTLGPVGRTVAVAPIIGNDPPEVLDTAATIAKRTIELADPFENPGAMLVRDLVLKVSEVAGDGGATTAVLTRELLREGNRLVTGGINVIRLCRGLRRGFEIARAALVEGSWKLSHPDEIARVAQHAVLDARVAETIGEILDTVGADGIVLVQEGHGTETIHQYVDGVRWDSGYMSAHLLPEGEATARVVEPRILITDQNIERPEQIVPAMEACIAAGQPRLVLIAPEMMDAALATLLANRRPDALTGALAITAPSIG